MKLTFKPLIDEMIAQEYIYEQKHPTADLYLYNYSQNTQLEWLWNEATIKCRGLIVDGENNIVARPFPKFFNLDQKAVDVIPFHESFEVFEKMDGSLGILYFIGETPHIATRGSFNSIQSKKATELLNTTYKNSIPLLKKDRTYLFEIIYPENRIVLDYGQAEILCLLAIIDNETGQDLPLEDIGFPLVKRYDGIKDIHTLAALEEDNREGFVVKFESGYRVKVKFEEYKRLHYIITNVSNLSIWEHLKSKKPFVELLELVPDEFYNWVQKTKKELQLEFKKVEAICKAEFKTFEDRKTAAAYFKTCTYPSILFSMLDNKDYADKIWRLIRPTYQRPFSK